jgi:hypothetical protein
MDKIDITRPVVRDTGGSARIIATGLKDPDGYSMVVVCELGSGREVAFQCTEDGKLTTGDRIVNAKRRGFIAIGPERARGGFRCSDVSESEEEAQRRAKARGDGWAVAYVEWYGSGNG